jgi:hypothetical protein
MHLKTTENVRQLDVRQVEIVSVEEIRDLEIDEAYEAAGANLTFNFGGTLAEADYPYKYEIYGADTPG